MDQQAKEIIKAMVEMAWADGQASPEESALLVRALQEAGADSNDLDSLSSLLAQPSETSVVQLDPAELDEDKRLGVMRALLIVSFMDGHVSFAEYAQIENWQAKLEISAEQMEVLRAEASAAAETLAAS